MLTKRITQNLLSICSLMFVLLCMAPYVDAEQVKVEAIGQYVVGDGPNENISAAKERARIDAMRLAAEKGGVFVESMSQVINSKLTKDEINVIAAQVMQINSENIQPVVEGNYIKYVCTLVATIDTNSIDIDKYISNKTALAENVKLQNELNKLKQENSILKEKYKNTSSVTEKDILAKQVIDNGLAFKKAVVEVPIAKDKHTTSVVDSSTVVYDKDTGIITFKVHEFGQMLNTISTIRIDTKRNSVQYLDCLDKSPITGKTTYKKYNFLPRPIYAPFSGTKEAIKIYQFLDIQPTNMYKDADWKLIYTSTDNTKYYIDIANSRYDKSRALASFPIKRYNENGLYTALNRMVYTDYNLFYYDYLYGKIGIWENKIVHDDPLLFNEDIIATCNKAKAICMTQGRKASIWEQ